MNELNEAELYALAKTYSDRHDYLTAKAIYLDMARDNPSLDGGTVGVCLAECYLALGDDHSAKYWLDAAVEENPAVWSSHPLVARLAEVTIDHLVQG